MKRTLALFASVAFALSVQACANNKPADAPRAPCASTERDCGPAKRLNESFAALGLHSPALQAA